LIILHLIRRNEYLRCSIIFGHRKNNNYDSLTTNYHRLWSAISPQPFLRHHRWWDYCRPTAGVIHLCYFYQGARFEIYSKCCLQKSAI